MNSINWFPGHMAKTRRQLEEQLKKIDVAVELCDARLPFSSRNPELDRMLNGKKRVLVLNKADLADEAVTKRWLSVFRSGGIEAFAFDASRMKKKDGTLLLENAAREAVEKAAARGVRKTVRAMVVGVPNVGKSTWINRIHGGNIAEAGDRPGVTRSNQWVRVSPWLELLDTPGLLWPRLDDQEAARRLCYIGSVKDDIVDVTELGLSLLKDMAVIRPKSLETRFHINSEDIFLPGVELMEAACRGRGFLLKGGLPDYERCARTALDEFRSGLMGRITLEEPGKESGKDPQREPEKNREIKEPGKDTGADE